MDLTSYKEFKKDHPEMIEKLRKIPDSIILSVAVKGSELQLIRKKIIKTYFEFGASFPFAE